MVQTVFQILLLVELQSAEFFVLLIFLTAMYVPLLFPDFEDWKVVL